MKIFTTCLLMLILHNVSMVYGEITRKSIYDNDGNENYIFHKDEKEIAKQRLFETLERPVLAAAAEGLNKKDILLTVEKILSKNR